MATFTLEHRGRTLGRYKLQRDVITIGRSRRNTIAIDNNAISRNHVRIVRSESGYELHDLGSLNGTYVNSERADRVRLADGDRIAVCSYVVVYHEADREGEPAPEVSEGATPGMGPEELESLTRTSIYVQPDVGEGEGEREKLGHTMPFPHEGEIPGSDPDNRLGVDSEVIDEQVPVVLLKVAGSIDHTNIRMLSEPIDRLLSEGKPNILIDLEKVGFISSTGWGTLAKALKELRKEERTIKLLHMPESLSEPFHLLSLDRLFPCFESVEEALEAFRSEKQAGS